MLGHSQPASRRPERIALPLPQRAGMIGTYAWTRIADQLRSAVPVVLYLLAVQVLLLGNPVHDGLRIAAGVAMVAVGLAMFLEGLMLAIMPVGELCGLGLPRRMRLPGILLVTALLGLLATVAEPAVVVLQRIGASVTPWDAPLLFVLLGRYTVLLVLAVSVGVGIAVAMGMLRSWLGWSLKPMLAVGVAALLGATLWARTEPNLARLCGLAWDTGAITTGDVTVPLILAIGAGLSRMAGRDEDEASGFGAVALASILPVLTVLALGAALLPSLPAPMSRGEFLQGDRKALVRDLFGDQKSFDRWAANNLSAAERSAWAASAATPLHGVAVAAPGAASGEPSQSAEGAATGSTEESAPPEGDDGRPETIWTVFLRAIRESAQAVLPLAVLLLAIVRIVLRQKLPWRDETALGVFFCLAGMTLFTAGLEIGLMRLGEQSGKDLPSLFLPADRTGEAVMLPSFDPSTMVFDSVSPDGKPGKYFLLTEASGPKPVPFVAERYDPATGTYLYIPRSQARIPGVGGWIALLLVAFGLGFTTTLVEPALAALGVSLENITVGVFPRQRLMLIVSVGVGFGTLAGFAMLVWRIPLLWILAPLYVVLLVLTVASSELFTGIAWDAGGATTGPITVPLVLAIGAGFGGTLGAAESFGILALASGFPILGVLLAGMSVTRRTGASAVSRVQGPVKGRDKSLAGENP